MKKKSFIVDFITKKRWLFAATIFFGICSSVLTILIPLSIGKYYDLLFDFHSKRAIVLNILPNNWQNSINHFVVFFLIMVVLRTILNFNQRYWTNYLGELFIKDIRERLFEHQLLVQQNVYEEKGIGKYLLRYSGDLNSIRNYFTVGIVRFIIDLTMMVVALITLFYLNWILGLILFCGLCLALIIIYFLNKILHKVSESHRNKKSGLLSFVNRSLLSIESVKTFNRYHIETKRFNKRSDKIFKLGVKYQLLNNLILSIVPGLLYISLAVILIVTAYFKNNSEQIDGNVLLGFILILITILPVIRRVLRVPTRWKIGNISFSKLIAVFELPVEHIDTGHDEFNRKNGSISFIDVRINKATKQKISFELKGGKTNLVNCVSPEEIQQLITSIVGVHAIKSGKISIDQQNIQQLDQKSLRRSIAIASVNLPFTGRSIYEAISYSKSNEKKEKAKQILEQLQADMDEDNKILIDSYIDEQANNLSREQKHVVAMARCLLAEKKILLLDSLYEIYGSQAYKNILKTISSEANKNKTLVFFDYQPIHTEIKKLVDNEVTL